MPRWALAVLLGLAATGTVALCVLAAVAIMGLSQSRTTSDQVCGIARQLAATPGLHVTVPASCPR